ncbi:hypothetical protein D1007_50286 [Hordeum vulgare]|nr:hypothetical protein D1007_50286 [Hordeum vulgare]
MENHRQSIFLALIERTRSCGKRDAWIILRYLIQRSGLLRLRCSLKDLQFGGCSLSNTSLCAHLGRNFVLQCLPDLGVTTPIVSEKLVRLKQTLIVEEYINEFSKLMDQLTTYETEPDMLDYTTCFVDGLKYSV